MHSTYPPIPQNCPNEVERRMAIETWARLILAKIVRDADKQEVAEVEA